MPLNNPQQAHFLQNHPNNREKTTEKGNTYQLCKDKDANTRRLEQVTRQDSRKIPEKSFSRMLSFGEKSKQKCD